MRDKGMRIALAESCTGGLLAAALTSVAGSSEYFYGGVVSYSNQAKIDFLAVAPQVLDSWGAVSAPTARQMAANVKARCGTDIGLAITGIAGPGGGSEHKPVGLVYFSLAAGGMIKVKKEFLSGDRQEVRLAAVETALSWLIQFLQGGDSNFTPKTIHRD
mgnify:CR=1 FL=1